MKYWVQFDPRDIISRTLVENVHTIYIGNVLALLFWTNILLKSMQHYDIEGLGQLLPQGPTLKNLDRGPLDNSFCQRSKL